MSFKFFRPIAFFDIESTGLDTANDRIVELAICKLHPDYSTDNFSWLINPQMLIPAEATAIHGITNDMVFGEPTFNDLSLHIWGILNNCDFGGFNSNQFDIPMLYNEFVRAGLAFDYSTIRFIDCGNIFKRKEPRTLAAAVEFYCKYELANAHSAAADINATVSVFLKQLEKYKDLPSDIDSLALYCNHDKPVLDLSGKFTIDKDGDIVFNFGSKRGVKAKNDHGYLQWMYSKDFAPDTVRIIESMLGITSNF
ncbi:DNA polymerase-3 subunit epsilon [Pedobacter westerhofensis]|uniref:DNA polymerase-3 subunit epsilon n=1 Tax=Pedobacter westerhofensis TaxID=425512 RepID=A0A521FW08_9SPHI|nr:3'-5' exonuclease [Pedobacter westerhofensis]SMO99951.1 DNA polymerase-3 subunit epsilon [Pedobacter westerhofensis]